MRTSLRVIAALSLAAGLTTSGALATGALADPVTRTPYGPITTPTLVTDLCPFPVTVTGTQTGYVIDQSLPSGGEQQIFHGTETDVFTANGKTLTGLPYTGTLQLTLDAQGNVTRFTSEGFAELVPLPQGGLFFSAGRTDWMLHPDDFFLANPDHGRLGNVAGLCAALS